MLIINKYLRLLMSFRRWCQDRYEKHAEGYLLGHAHALTLFFSHLNTENAILYVQLCSESFLFELIAYQVASVYMRVRLPFYYHTLNSFSLPGSLIDHSICTSHVVKYTTCLIRTTSMLTHNARFRPKLSRCVPGNLTRPGNGSQSSLFAFQCFLKFFL